MRTALLFLVVLGFTPAVYSQGLIHGKISSEQSALSNATVILNGRHSLSDSSGKFIFDGLTAGRYILQVSMTGHEPYRKSFNLSVNDSLALDIRLQTAPSSMDAVVITGTMKAVKKLESPIAVEVYSPQFFKKNPSPSIFESLQQVNGVRPQINCSVCNTGDIHINGLEGPYTMVTIDGMPIVSSLSSVYGLFGIPNELIDRVEIIKGPASGLYGSEAIGGLINIITKSPEKAPLFSMSMMSTSWKEHSADIGIKWKIKKLQSLTGINYFNYQDPKDNNHDHFTDVTLQHRISIFNKWSLQRPNQRAASLAARYFYENRWGGDLRWNKSFRGTDSIYGESIYTKRWELIGNYQLPAREKIFFSFSATGHNQDSYYGVTPYMADQKILFGQLMWDTQFGNDHSVLAGTATRYNYYDDNSTATIDTLSKINKPDNYIIPAVFVQDEWKLNSNHTLLLGLRYDYHPVHHAIFTPRIAYKWRINDRQTLRMNAGTGFRVVNLFTEDHAALTGARAVEIREALEPEKSYNVNLNYMRQFGSRSMSFGIDISTWFSWFNNQIFADYDTDPNKIIYGNLTGYALSKGLTMNLEANILQRLKGMVGATFQQVEKVDNSGAIKIRQTPVLTEKWSATWSVTYSLPSLGITADYTGNLYGPMRLPLTSSLDPRQPYSPVWSIQNIQLTKRFSQKFEIFGGIKNLLNWTPAKNNPFLIARSHDPFDKKVEYDAAGNIRSTTENPYALSFDPSYTYAPNQGLRFFAGMRMQFKN